MAVPVGTDLFRGGVLGSAIYLHKPNTPFGESAGEKALPAKGADLGVIQFVQFFGGFGFPLEIRCLGSTQLEPSRHFVGLYAGFQFGVSGPRRFVHLIEFLQKGQTGLIVFRASFLEGRGREEVGDRLIRIIDAYCARLVLGGQKSCSPVDNPSGRQSADVGQDDEGWQVVGFTPQTVSDPRTHTGESGENLSGIHHEVARAVEGGFALHGMNEGHVVHAGGKFGE